MFTKKSYTITHAGISHPSRSRTGFVAYALLAGGIALTLYFYVFPELGDRFPFTCALPGESAEAAILPAGDLPPEPGIEQTCDPQTGACKELVDVTGQGDTLYSLLDENIDDEASVKQAAAALRTVIRSGGAGEFDVHSQLREGKRYSILLDGAGDFLRASIELDAANVFFAEKKNGSIRAWKEDVVLDFKTEALTLKMRGTLADSVHQAGEGAELAAKLTNVFRWDIDFQSDAARGDTCRILVERRYADDKPSGYGSILYAVYEGKKTGRKTAVFFSNEYFDEHGVELQKNFLRSPLSVMRVTSGFGARFHPILHQWRQHKGVDYGAASGTPVWSVAAGTVVFAGWQGGYGNYVCVKHDNGYESRYGHLQKYFVQVGQRVKQRQRIGLVGATGQATAPHLDFQLLLKNKHVNPAGVKLVKNLRTVPPALKQRFSELTSERVGSLEKTAYMSGDDSKLAVGPAGGAPGRTGSIQ